MLSRNALVRKSGNNRVVTSSSIFFRANFAVFLAPTKLKLEMRGDRSRLAHPVVENKMQKLAFWFNRHLPAVGDEAAFTLLSRAIR